MINHLQTLFLNENSIAAEADGVPWFVDPSFVPARTAGADAEFLSVLFAGCQSVSDRARVVLALSPFLNMPDMSKYRHRFDRREALPAQGAIAVLSGAAGLGVAAPDIAACLSVQPAGSMFEHSGNEESDTVIDELRSIYFVGFEAPHRFAALLYAEAERLELARISLSGRHAS